MEEKILIGDTETGPVTTSTTMARMMKNLLKFATIWEVLVKKE